MQIAFKAKVRTMFHMDDTPAYRYVDVPTLKRHHVDMQAARRHPTYQGIANSDLFPNALARIRQGLAPSGRLRLDALPEGVTVRELGPLVEVAFSR